MIEYKFDTRLIFFLFFRNESLRTLDNILGHIGNTPLVKLNNIPKSFGLKCDVCEYLTSADSPVLLLQYSTVVLPFLLN